MKFHRIMAVLLLSANLNPLLSYSENTSEDIIYNGMTFRHQLLYPDELILTEYTGNDENLVIPENIGDYIVTAIDNYVFEDNQNIKNVTLPDTIIYFGRAVFHNSSLVSVNIPKNLQVIPMESFNNCSELETVIFHDEIMVISHTAFRKTDIEIPLELYDTVKNQYIETSNTHIYYLKDGWDYVMSYVHGNMYVTINGYFGNDTELIIPDFIDGAIVTAINYGLELSPSVRSISFPDTLTFEGFDIKIHNPELEEITLPSFVEKIPSYAFKDCTNLRKINFRGNPEKLIICEHAFENCTNIESISYPESCKNIEIRQSAFKNAGINEVIIDADSSIGKDAFHDCKNLSYVELNNTSVNSRAFRDCPALEDITVTGNSVIEEMSFCNCELLKNITFSDLDIQMTNPVYNCPELMTINNQNVFDSETGDFNKDLKDFIFSNFSGVDDVGFINMYVQAQAQKIVEEITSDNMSDVQKIKAIHDWICSNTVYDDGQVSDRKNHNDASVLMNDSTVCEGYARIANILYNTAGIESYYISGVNHTWNIVRAGSNYFHVDTTWDDDDKISYEWFMKSDEELRESGGNHAKWSAYIPSSMHSFQKDTLPECNYSMGDVNQDGKINIADMLVLNKYILCQKNINYDSYVLSDLTFDGIVDAFDLVKMKQTLINQGDNTI